ncbi:hypothetical protein [Sinorhizobium meliloti]|nr:hypothetical protein [Sinorhizobium meliloti]
METQTQLAAVNAEGFDEAQGYLFAALFLRSRCSK